MQRRIHTFGERPLRTPMAAKPQQRRCEKFISFYTATRAAIRKMPNAVVALQRIAKSRRAARTQLGTIGCRHNVDLAKLPVSFLAHPDHMLELGLPIEFAVSFPFSAANWFKRAAFSNLRSYENQLGSKSGVFRQRIGCIRMVQLLLHH